MRKIIFVLFAFSPSILIGQNPDLPKIQIGTAQPNRLVDSIRLYVSQATDSNQFELAMNAMRALLDTDPENALEISLLATDYAMQSGDSLSIVKGLFAQCYILKQLEKYNESIAIAKTIIEIAKRNRYYNEIRKALNTLAISYTFLGSYDKALESYFQSLVLSEEFGNLDAASMTLNNIGLLYYKLDNCEEAIKYYKKSLAYKKQIKSEYDLDRLLINIALCYNQTGDYQVAENHITQALEVCKNNCSDIILTEAKFGLAITYRLQGQSELSMNLLKEVITISKKLNEKRFRIESLAMVGSIFSEKGRYDSAIFYFSQASEIAIAYNYSEQLIDIYKMYSDVYRHLNDYKNEAIYLKKYSDLRDSTFNTELVKNLSVVQVQFAERENRAIITYQNEILALREESLDKQRVVIVLTAFSTLLVILIAFFLYRNNQLRKQTNRILENKVQDRTRQLEESHEQLIRQSKERDKEVERIYTELNASMATLKGLSHIVQKDSLHSDEDRYFKELRKTLEQLAKIKGENHRFNDTHT